jgi:hypothetical protein
VRSGYVRFGHVIECYVKLGQVRKVYVSFVQVRARRAWLHKLSHVRTVKSKLGYFMPG